MNDGIQRSPYRLVMSDGLTFRLSVRRLIGISSVHYVGRFEREILRELSPRMNSGYDAPGNYHHERVLVRNLRERHDASVELNHIKPVREPFRIVFVSNRP